MIVPTPKLLDIPLGRATAALIRAYQVIVSSRLPAVCVYEPSCSEYARLHLSTVGLFAGLPSVLDRLNRCRGGEFQGIDLPPSLLNR
jgi:uncharacterized protein